MEVYLVRTNFGDGEDYFCGIFETLDKAMCDAKKTTNSWRFVGVEEDEAGDLVVVHESKDGLGRAFTIITKETVL